MPISPVVSSVGAVALLASSRDSMELENNFMATNDTCSATWGTYFARSCVHLEPRWQHDLSSGAWLSAVPGADRSSVGCHCSGPDGLTGWRPDIWRWAMEHEPKFIKMFHHGDRVIGNIGESWNVWSVWCTVTVSYLISRVVEIWCSTMAVKGQ